jgi:hypothetical protein
MEHLFLNLACGLAAVTYLASFFCFDRLLQVESASYHEQWLKDGQPIVFFTWGRHGGVAFGLRGVGALLSFLRCYVLWIFSTPAWVRGDLSAHRFISAARLLLVITIVELCLIKETLM